VHAIANAAAIPNTVFQEAHLIIEVPPQNGHSGGLVLELLNSGCGMWLHDLDSVRTGVE